MSRELRGLIKQVAWTASWETHHMGAEEQRSSHYRPQTHLPGHTAHPQ